MAYTLTHPDSEQEIEVEAAQVPMYLAQGWATKPNARSVEVPDAAPVVTDVVGDVSANKKAK